MARQTKSGISYFSHDTNMMSDIKIKLIKAKHGLIGYAIYLRLLEELYLDKGYYLPISDDFNILFVDDNNLSLDVYKEVFNDCILNKLFTPKMYEKHKILTSERIQYNYCEAVMRRKKVDFIKEYLLIDTEEVFNTKDINVNISTLNANISTQSKVNKTKEDKTKVKEKPLAEKFNDLINERTTNEKVKIAINEFIEYKKGNKTLWKSTMGLTKMINLLDEYSNGDDETKVLLVDTAIANSWKGIYPLKNNTKPNYNNQPKSRKDKSDDYLKELYAKAKQDEERGAV